MGGWPKTLKYILDGVAKRGIKYCDECKQWLCELLKREALIPIDLQKFKKLMSKFEEKT